MRNLQSQPLPLPLLLLQTEHFRLKTPTSENCPMKRVTARCRQVSAQYSRKMPRTFSGSRMASKYLNTKCSRAGFIEGKISRSQSRWASSLKCTILSCSTKKEGWILKWDPSVSTNSGCRPSRIYTYPRSESGIVRRLLRWCFSGFALSYSHTLSTELSGLTLNAKSLACCIGHGTPNRMALQSRLRNLGSDEQRSLMTLPYSPSGQSQVPSWFLVKDAMLGRGGGQYRQLRDPRWVEHV